VKRLFDLFWSVIGLSALWPLLLIIAAWVKLDSKGPVFYRGVRAGRGGKPFRILKFRTMVTDAERLGGPSTSSDDPRMTRSGNFLRRFKLDELPQLLNVLWGQMSLVGPRPEVLSEVELYDEEQRRVLDLRPGITDWATLWNVDEGAVLAGAQDPHLAYKERIQPTKLRLQLLYARDASVATDMKIILYTLLRMAKKGWVPKELRDVPAPIPVREGGP